MMSRLRVLRVSWPQILVVAATSAIATVLIINAAGRGGVPSAELAALTHRVVVHTVPSTAHAPVPVRSPAAAAPASSAPPPSAASQSSASAQTSQPQDRP